MFIQLSIGNFRSFSNIQTFTMVAAPLTSQADLDLEAKNVFEDKHGVKMLRSAAIYGANAAGKSNLFQALEFLKYIATQSFSKLEPGEAIPAQPFLLSTVTENEPSFVEVVFEEEGRRFRYGLEADETAIVSEWLYEQTSSRETRLFTREGQSIDPNKSAFREGEKFKNYVRPNASFLSVCAALEGPVSKLVSHWIRYCNVINGLNDNNYTAITLSRLLGKRNDAEIREFVRNLDINLERLTLVFPDGDPLQGKKVQSVRVVDQEEANLLKKGNEGQSGKIKEIKGSMIIATPQAKRDENGKVVGEATLNLITHGSEGTQKLFSYAGPLVDTLQNGMTLFVDEFDARLHPLISSALVKLFNSPQTNPKNAQLVFATHDVNLLDSRALRRDQVWFAEKDNGGATQLYSLAQFRLENGDLPRPDSSFESDYIKGKFGGIPFLGDFSSIFGNSERTTFDLAQPEAVHG